MSPTDGDSAPNAASGLLSVGIDLAGSSNVSAILSVLHEHGRVSRAQVTRRTGRSRSSIAEAVGALESAGLVSQLPPSESGRAGRPSLRLEPTERYVVAAVNPDIDGVRVGLYTVAGRLLAEAFEPSQGHVPAPEAAAISARLVRQLADARPEAAIVGLCAAIPGWVDKSARRVEHAQHLGWHDVPFADLLETATGLPSRLVYDAIAGLAAENLWGRARQASNVVYLYGGPGGIGAAALVDGRLLSGQRGHAGRLGHLIVADDGPACSCGNVGCLTSLVSASTVSAALAMRTPMLAHASVDLRTTPTDDPYRSQYVHVARALRIVSHTYDPSLIILGGFFAQLLERDRLFLEALLRGPAGAINDPVPSLLEPTSGTHQVLAGASHFAMLPLLADPLGVANPDETTTTSAP